MNTAQASLTSRQLEIAERVLAEESARRSHVVISLSGAHAYGFPSPDSDLDLKAVHLAPTRALLGFPSAPAPAERLEIIEGVEIDYSSNELGGVLQGVLKGNGNYLERFLSRYALITSPSFSELATAVRENLSTRLARHYRGFATQQRLAWESTGQRSVKKLLYVLRTLLTGIHALREAEIETDLRVLAPKYALAHAAELIEWKRHGERSELDDALAARWAAQLDGVFTGFDAAERASVLPPEPARAESLEQLLISLRQRA